MAIIKPIRGIYPNLGKNNYLADNAVIVGEVQTGDDCSIWFNAVVRGDVNSIIIGNKTNIQDGAVIHCTYQKANTVVGNNVSIAHNAIVHGCTVEDNVLIGMGAIVMDHAVVGTGSIIAAGAVVLANTKVEPHSIYAGTPARRIKAAGEELHDVFTKTAENYVIYATWYTQE